EGLAEDVQFYGQWMRDEVGKRVGHFYPKVEITAELAKGRPDLKPLVGKKLTVIAWLWARTVKSPNPAFSNVDVPLVSTFILSSKEGREVYIEPVVGKGSYRFRVKLGTPPIKAAQGTKEKGRGSAFRWVMSDTAIEGDYIKSEGQAGRMSMRLMAIVAGGTRGRVYLSASAEHEAIALTAQPGWTPDIAISGSTQYLGVKPYGMDRFADIF